MTEPTLAERLRKVYLHARRESREEIGMPGWLLDVFAAEALAWLKERLHAFLVGRYRFKNIAGEYRCDDCCHAWPDVTGLPLSCIDEPMNLCQEGHECDVRLLTRTVGQ